MGKIKRKLRWRRSKFPFFHTNLQLFVGIAQKSVLLEGEEEYRDIIIPKDKKRLTRQLIKKQKIYGLRALVMMFISTIAVLINPDKFAKADSILMMMYGSLSALVGAYFGFAKNNNDKSK